MIGIALPNAAGNLPAAIEHLKAAAEAEKCRSCGCLHGTLEQLREAFASGDAPLELVQVAELARFVHFRKTVRVYDRIGSSDAEAIVALARECAQQYPGPAGPWAGEHPVPVIAPRLAQRTVQDPAGYCVIYADRARGLLSLEHYRNDGVLDALVEGRTAAEVCTPALEEGLISRLDHAAYLGRELARAEEALRTGQTYRQDAAPDATVCGCGSSGQCSPKIPKEAAP